MTASSRATTFRGNRALPWILGVLALVVVAAVAGRPGGGGGDGDYLGPDSTGPYGARGLVLLLESYGAEVDTEANLPSSDTDVALMLTDVIAAEDEAAVEDWVFDGGTLVVADGFSALAPPLADTAAPGFGIPSDEYARGDCSTGLLPGIETLVPGTNGDTFESPVGSASCFTESDFGSLPGAYVVVSSVGRGEIVSIGGPGPFLNDWLDEADNAALATAVLLDPAGPGDDGGPVEVALLQYGGGSIESDRSLTDVMGTGAKIALVQLALGFVAYAWYRARRVGRPIVETQPVALEGSDLVAAVGQLLQQSDDPDRSARALRADLRRRLGERFGLGPDADPATTAAVVAERTGADRNRLFAALDPRPVSTDHDLVELASDIDDLRKEILHGP